MQPGRITVASSWKTRLRAELVAAAARQNSDECAFEIAGCQYERGEGKTLHDELKPGDPIRVHDVVRPHQPVKGRYIGRSPNRHWLVDVAGETQLVAAEVVDRIETDFDDA